jgi:hypothetical protein
MDSQINSFYDIINDKNITEPNTVYDELRQKEDKYYETINKTIDIKQQELSQQKYFQFTTLQNFVITLFLTLNSVIKEILNIDKSTSRYDFFQIFIKDQRLIYNGFILIFIGFIMLLILVTDN